ISANQAKYLKCRQMVRTQFYCWCLLLTDGTGGCLRPCDARLSCGHHCPYKCHSDDEHHIYVRCTKPCTRLCVRSHPCNKVCSAPCGNCPFLVRITLDCGHENDVPWCVFHAFNAEDSLTVVISWQID